MKRTDEQDKIIATVKDSVSTGIEAKAGSGKTTLGAEAAKEYNRKRWQFIVFNKKNAEEFARKLPSNASGLTAHSFCNKFIGSPRPQLDSSGGKMFKIIFSNPDYNFKTDGLSKEDQLKTREDLNEMKKLVSLLKNSFIDPQVADAAYLIDHYGMTFNVSPEQACSDAVDFVRQSDANRMVIDFDDMVRFPIIGNRIKPSFDYFFLDEAQDNTPIRNELLRQMKEKGVQVIFCGDRCQPTGTKILSLKQKGNAHSFAKTKEINIEDLKVGDKVISYCERDCAFVGERKVTGITKRPYSGRLIVATTEFGDISKYTPNHHCFANFEALRNKYIIYIMRCGSRYRIGKSKFSYETSTSVTSTGVVSRARAEGADAFWILAAYDSECEALLMEQAISGKYGITQLRFQNNSCVINSEWLEQAWEYIGDNSERAKACLESFGRDINYPLYESKKHKYFSLKRPIVVYASNLMAGVKMAPYKKDAAHLGKHQWRQINISEEQYVGFVYSLTVEKDHMYVADGLVTHNCQAIYGFAGADCDSMDKIQAAINPIILPLTINFRCGKNIITEAQKIVPEIKAFDGAIDGEVIQGMTMDDFERIFQYGDCALSRLNRVIIPICFRLIKKGLKATIAGRDFGAMLKNMVRDFKCTSIEEFYSAIERWQERQLKYAKSDQATEAINDRYDCLKFFADNSDTVEQIITRIDKIFDDSQGEGFKLSTSHRSKGMEWDNVYILDSTNFMKTHPNMQSWEVQQLRNLYYVSITRAKKKLGFVI